MAMFSPPISSLAAGVVLLPGSRGSSLTPLDGMRPIPVPDAPFNTSGMMQPPGNRGRAASANTRPSPLAASGRMAASAVSSLQANNLSEADNIKVAVRVRPLFAHETERGGTPVVQVSSNTTIKVVVPGPAGTSMQRDFAFHACLGSEVGQADVLALCGVPQLLDAALAGYNVTIFAYGQTGSGKTYTMSGREEVIGSDSYTGDTHDGIMTRAIQHLYGAMEARKQDTKYGVAASYLEIYNEGIYDLLNLKAKNLPVKWDAALGFFVPGLKQVPCAKIDTMMEVIRTGMQHRHVGSHELNIESSRSHSIMTICLTATPTDPAAADYGTPRMGKISFVDLAGSERLKDTKSEGAMLRETTNINKSLFVLGKVIAALAERDSAGTSAHIPYRDSKLTKLLMDSLGGNSLALMIACCSPASTAVEETLSTLSYATRAKNIQNRPTVQYDPREAQIANLRREIELLRQENTYLREQVRLGGGGGGGVSPGPYSDCPTPLHAPRPAWPPPSCCSEGGPGPASSALGNGSNSGQVPWPSLLGAPDSAAGSSRDSGRDGGGGGGGAAPPHLPPRLVSSSRMVTSASPEGHRGMLTSAAGAHLEPLRMSGDVAAAATVLAAAAAAGAGANGTGSGGGGMSSRRMSVAGPMDDDMMRRLMDTQTLLARFSEENGRLAKENDRLRAGRQLLSQEHGEVLDEIETLRSKLVQLESAVLSGAQTPNAAKAALLSAVGASAALGSRVDSPGGGSGSSSPLLASMQAGMPGMPGGPSPSPSPLRARGHENSSLGHGQAAASPASSLALGGPAGQALAFTAQQQAPHVSGGGGVAAALGSAAGQYWSPSDSSLGGYPGHALHPAPQQQPHQPQQNPYHLPQQQQQQQHPPPERMRSTADPHMPPPGPAAQQQQQQHHQQPPYPAQPHQQQHPHPSQSHPSQPHPSQSHPPPHAPANVMSVGPSPGNSGAMRSRAKYGSGGGGTAGGGGGGDDSIIVADRSKLALLLGEGPVEPAVPVRPLPIKPPEPSYANPAKAHHAQHLQLQKQLQRSSSNPASPTAAAAAASGAS